MLQSIVAIAVDDDDTDSIIVENNKLENNKFEK